MELGNIIDLFAVLISAVSAVSVVVMSVQQTKRTRQEKQQDKKNTWYRSEVISEEKMKEHIEVELSGILNNSKLSKFQMCTELNEAMLSFFYRSVNYMAFFNLKKYNALKLKIMAEIDNIMYSVLIEEGALTPDKADKILEIYRMKLIYLFYDYEMSIE